MIAYIIFAVTVICGGMITLFGNIVSSPFDFWKPFLILLGIFVGLWAIFTGLTALSSFLPKEQGKVVGVTRWFTLNFIESAFVLMGVHIHITGMEKIPEDKPFLFVSNHLTVFDPCAAIAYFRKYRLVFISKKENFDMPVVGGLITGCGCLSLDRENDRAAVKTIIEAAKLVKDGGVSMGIYPEGGTNRTDKPLLPFRNGAFKVAQRGHAPIVVTTIRGTEKIMSRMFRKPTHVYIDVLRVIPFEDIDHVHTNEVGELVYDIMLENLEKNRSK